jgi:hypothetical protein
MGQISLSGCWPNNPQANTQVVRRLAVTCACTVRLEMVRETYDRGAARWLLRICTGARTVIFTSAAATSCRPRRVRLPSWRAKVAAREKEYPERMPDVILCRLAVKCQTGVEAATARSPSAHLAEGEGCQYAGAAGCPSLSGSGSLAAAEFD